MGTRNFSAQLNAAAPQSRTVADAPMSFRLEFIDAVFQLAENSPYIVTPAKLYGVMIQSMGIDKAPANPMGGHREGAVRQIKNLEWPRVYDLVLRWWSEFSAHQDDYVSAVNAVLSGHGIAWELREDGTLARVLPVAVQAQVGATFGELSQPRFAAGLASFRAAMNAYDARPQRGRDACKNVLDTLESVAKEVFNLPTGTFGNVLTEVRKQQSMANETISVLQKLYDMANNHFRHGMTTPFLLKPSEVDFVMLSCMAGILLFIRL